MCLWRCQGPCTELCMSLQDGSIGAIMWRREGPYRILASMGNIFQSQHLEDKLQVSQSWGTILTSMRARSQMAKRGYHNTPNMIFHFYFWIFDLWFLSKWAWRPPGRLGVVGKSPHWMHSMLWFVLSKLCDSACFPNVQQYFMVWSLTVCCCCVLFYCCLLGGVGCCVLLCCCNLVAL